MDVAGLYGEREFRLQMDKQQFQAVNTIQQSYRGYFFQVFWTFSPDPLWQFCDSKILLSIRKRKATIRRQATGITMAGIYDRHQATELVRNPSPNGCEKRITFA